MYDIGNNRWCGNINREHKSNHIYYIADLKLNVIFQKCHDPECTNYRSLEVVIPSGINPTLVNLNTACDVTIDDFELSCDEELNQLLEDEFPFDELLTQHQNRGIATEEKMKQLLEDEFPLDELFTQNSGIAPEAKIASDEANDCFGNLEAQKDFVDLKTTAKRNSILPDDDMSDLSQIFCIENNFSNIDCGNISPGSISPVKDEIEHFSNIDCGNVSHSISPVKKKIELSNEEGTTLQEPSLAICHNINTEDEKSETKCVGSGESTTSSPDYSLNINRNGSFIDDVGIDTCSFIDELPDSSICINDESRGDCSSQTFQNTSIELFEETRSFNVGETASTTEPKKCANETSKQFGSSTKGNGNAEPQQKIECTGKAKQTMWSSMKGTRNVLNITSLVEFSVNDLDDDIFLQL